MSLKQRYESFSTPQALNLYKHILSASAEDGPIDSHYQLKETKEFYDAILLRRKGLETVVR